MNAPFLICLVLCIGFGMESLRQRRINRAAKPRTPYHIYHGPNSGCPDCVDK